LPKLFLGVLLVAWIVVLVPPVLRARNDSRSRGDSIGDFQNRLGVLGRTHSRQSWRKPKPVGAGRGDRRGDLGQMPGVASLGPRAVAAPNRLAAARLGTRRSIPTPLAGPLEPVRTPGAERSARRRREVVTVLFTSAILSAAVASAVGGTALWALHILIDLLLLTYVGGMLWFRSNGADRKRTVHYLPTVRPRPVPAYALRRTASS
jgi:hypothetical protein